MLSGTEARRLLARVTRAGLAAGFGGMLVGFGIALLVWGLNSLSPGLFAADSLLLRGLQWFYTLLEPVVFLGLLVAFGGALLLVIMLLLGIGRRRLG